MTISILLAHATFALLVFLLFPVKQCNSFCRALILIGAFFISFIPIQGLSLGDYMLSYTDELAITTLLWFVICAGNRVLCGRGFSKTHKLSITLYFGVFGLLLYPATLGLAQVDPYRLGFSPMPLLLGMFAVCLIAWWQRLYLLLGLITAATLAFVVDVKNSDNYWDYLLDPLLVVYCWGYLVRVAWHLSRARLSQWFSFAGRIWRQPVSQ